MIQGNEISVIIQGPIVHKNNLTHTVIQAVRALINGAEIILSTWEGENTSELKADIIVKNIDPGGYNISGDLYNNVNRQIVSTKNGIEISKRKYILKLRTDVLLRGIEFIKDFEKYSKYDFSSKYHLFSSRIIASQFYFRNPCKTNYLFHISDIFLFGEKRDLISLFDVDLAERKDLINLDTGKGIKSKIRNSAEQYIWISFLNRKGLKVGINYLDDLSLRNFLLSELTILGNFIIMEPEKIKIDLPTRMYGNSIDNLYSFEFWRFYSKLSKNEAYLLSAIRFGIAKGFRNRSFLKPLLLKIKWIMKVGI